MQAAGRRLRIYRIGEDGCMGFTDIGIETLTEFVRIHKEKSSSA